MHALDVDADGLGAQRGIAAGAHGIAERREQKPPQQQHACHRQRQRKQEIDPRLVEWRRRPHADHAVRAAGKTFPLEHRRPDNLRESQGEHGEIDAGEPHRKPAEQQRAGERDQRRRGECPSHRKAEPFHQQRRAIGAEPEIGGMAERVHAARPHDEMQRGGEDHRDQYVDAEDQEIWRVLRQQRQAQQQRQHRDAERLQCRRSRAKRVLRLGDRAHHGLRAAEQPVRARDQHHRHHQEFGDQRQLGEIHADETEIHYADADANGFDFGDDDGGEIGPADRAHAAHHHHHEGVADRHQVGGEIGRLARDLQRTAEPGERRAERKYGGEQHRLIDTERADHLAVLRRRPHQPAEARSRQREMQGQQHQRTDENQE